MPQDINIPSLSSIDGCDDTVNDMVIKLNSNFGVIDNPGTTALIGLGSPANSDTVLNESTDDFFWITTATLNEKLSNTDSLIPVAHNTYDLGTVALQYANAFINTLNVTDINVSNSIIYNGADVLTISGDAWYINGVPMTTAASTAHSLDSHDDILFPAARDDGKVLVSRAGNRFDYEYPALIDIENNIPSLNDTIGFDGVNFIPTAPVDPGDSLTTVGVQTQIDDSIALLDPQSGDWLVEENNLVLGGVGTELEGANKILMNTESGNKTLSLEVTGGITLEGTNVEVITYLGVTSNTLLISTVGVTTINGASTYTMDTNGQRLIMIYDVAADDFRVSDSILAAGAGPYIVSNTSNANGHVKILSDGFVEMTGLSGSVSNGTIVVNLPVTMADLTYNIQATPKRAGTVTGANIAYGDATSTSQITLTLDSHSAGQSWPIYWSVQGFM